MKKYDFEKQKAWYFLGVALRFNGIDTVMVKKSLQVVKRFLIDIYKTKLSELTE